MNDLVILVDEKDNNVGKQEKMKAHEDAQLHRAFSIFVYNSTGDMLLQQRADEKYHSGGLWTNTCCSHPRPDESVEQAAHRRLQEEMGFDTQLEEKFTFIYKAALDHELTEHELDHVLVGFYDGEIHINKNEAKSYRWVNTDWLMEDIEQHPERYTVWFKIAFAELLKRDKKSQNQT
ncbi:isopentenyl-diphosphate Delta-isomerase [candidate division KSB1 bacterium]|nr:isopentenyl-diphosphate Delta-isomerase [candidate division KSB1 bacterium]